MQNQKKIIALIVPAYNEERNILKFCNTFFNGFLREYVELEEKYTFKVIFINDGSIDSTYSEIQKAVNTYERVGYINLSRNFGKESATSAGLENIISDASIIIDADLQHPLATVYEFIKKWEEGYDVVVGVRENDRHENILKYLGSRLYHGFFRKFAEDPIPNRITDFCLLDRRVIDAFAQFTEKQRMTRTLIHVLGFRKVEVSFTADDRTEGVSTYTFGKLFSMTINDFISSSNFPLRFTRYLGFLTVIFAGMLGLFMIIEKYILNDPFNLNFSAIGQLAVLNTFFIGVLLSAIGIIGLYLEKIKKEILNRPLYVIRDKKTHN